MQLVDGLKLEVLVVLLAEYSILVVSSLANHSLERSQHLKQAQLCWIFYLCQAIVLVILDDRLADSLFEKGRVREDTLATFELGGVWRQQVLHQPTELLRLYF